ncbi:MAG: GHMP kinase [Nitrospinales bacterium]
MSFPMIKSVAPTRIDLAGGTLDIWPLYLMLGNPPTLNAAINLYASVELRPRRDRAIHIESKDLNIKEQFRSVDNLPQNHPLDLILKTLHFYRPKTGLNIVTECQAPAGSGIGGSSALAVALNGALNRLSGRRYKKSQFIPIAQNIETQTISTLTGWQDYYPALYGGALAIQPGMAGVTPETMPVDLDALTQRMVLCYTGKPRRSGINNWRVLKKALDGDRTVLRKLARIAEVSLEMKRVLIRGNIDRAAQWFNEEWNARKALAPGISSPQTDRLISAASKRGALAAKTCGAGGGGCVAFFVRKGAKERVVRELQTHGGQVLDFRFVKRGLRVRQVAP